MITGQLGQGGMGTVYRAFDTTLQRPVAIKVLSEADEQGRGKLLAEARAASALSHPNVATVFEVSEADGQPYIVMELVEGKPLSELRERCRVPMGSISIFSGAIVRATSGWPTLPGMKDEVRTDGA